MTAAAPVLVAYATRYGSTQEVAEAEVAEAVAGTLREGGLETAIQPMREVHTLEGYGALVLGALVLMGRWHKDAQGFLSQHREALAGRPAAIFALGPLSTDEQEILEARSQLDEELEKHSWLTPLALEMFGGKYDPSKLSFSHRLLTAVPASPFHGLPESDARDWKAIRAWASDLAQ